MNRNPRFNLLKILSVIVVLVLCLQPNYYAQDKEIKYDPKTGQPLVTIIMDQPMERVLSKISDQTGVNLVAEGRAVGANVSLVEKEAPLMEVLEKVASSNSLILFSKEGEETIRIMDQQHFEQNYLPDMAEKRIYYLENVPPEEFVQMLQSGVLTQNIGTAAINARDSSVVVFDLPQVHVAIEEIVEWIEVKPVLRVFKIHKGNLEFIVDTIRNESQRFRGTEADIVVDNENRRIIVQDTLEHIKRYETWVELLDTRPELRSYQLHNVGLDASGIDTIQTAIDQILSQDAYVQFDEQNHVMLVRDIPEVHDDIEIIISQIDVAPPQVLVQAELIETIADFSLSYGTDIDFSDDLFSAAIDGLFPDVPTGSGDATNAGTLGFLNFQEAFPIISTGGGGIAVDNLTRRARVSFSAAMSDSNTRILASPRIYVKNRDSARLNIGGQVPFLTSTINTNNSSNNRTFSQQTQEEGVTLEVEVAISGQDMVEMDVSIFNNDASIEGREFDGEDFELVGLRTEEIETVLIIPNGNTRVIGGLINRSRAENKSGVPYLYKIPIIGPLIFGRFTQNPEENFDRNLMVYLTPYIIRPKKSKFAEDPSEIFQPRGYSVEKERESLLDQFDIQGFLERQFSGQEELESIEPIIEETDDGQPSSMPTKKETVMGDGIKLNKYFIELSWASAQELEGSVERLLSDGEVLEVQSTENIQAFTIRTSERNIGSIENFLTRKNQEAAEENLSLDPPESLVVKAELIRDTSQIVAEGKWDPAGYFSTYKSRVGKPTATIGNQPIHRGTASSSSRRSSSGRSSSSARRSTSRVQTSASSRNRSSRSSASSSRQNNRSNFGNTRNTFQTNNSTRF